MSTVLTNPTSDRITREREFRPVHMRQDRKDLMAQILVTLGQLLDEKVEGNVIITLSPGRILDIKVREVQRLPKNS